MIEIVKEQNRRLRNRQCSSHCDNQRDHIREARTEVTFLHRRVLRGPRIRACLRYRPSFRIDSGEQDLAWLRHLLGGQAGIWHGPNDGAADECLEDFVVLDFRAGFLGRDVGGWVSVDNFAERTVGSGIWSAVCFEDVDAVDAGVELAEEEIVLGGCDWNIG